MPKIIENLESKLIQEARRQIAEIGYSAMTIRSVAKACGVGVGTVYNYFPSKEALVATHLLEDWKQCVTAVLNQHAEYIRHQPRSYMEKWNKFHKMKIPPFIHTAPTQWQNCMVFG